jgi:acetyltransferase-like isoleucine patch superfamily enzyme
MNRVKNLSTVIKRHLLGSSSNIPDPSKAKSFIVKNSHVEIGRFTYGIDHLKIREWGEGASLKIGSFCSIADEVTIFLGGNHRVDWLTTFPFGHVFVDHFCTDPVLGHPSTNGSVSIGNDVWLGSNVTVMSGVSIASGAVIAANSTVTRDVLPYEIVGGNPARSIRLRFEQTVVEKLIMLSWWDMEVGEIENLIPTLLSEPSLDNLDFLLSELGRSTP